MTDRMCWINWMYGEYCKDNFMECEIDPKNGRTEVCKRESKYVKKIAVSYCSPADKFDRKTGIAIAYARLIKKKIPNCVLYDRTKVKDVKIGEMFVLKFNHKTYVKVCEHPSYPNEYECTSTENGETVIISNDSEVEKIF